MTNISHGTAKTHLCISNIITSKSYSPELPLASPAVVPKQKLCFTTKALP